MKQIISGGLLLLGLSASAMAQPGAAGAVSVITAEVAVRDMALSHRLPGSVRAEQALVLRASVSERITRLNFRDGQTVKAGDVLVELALAEEQAQLQAAEARQLEADAELRRVLQLHQQALSSEAQLDLARAAAKAAEAAVQQAQAALDERRIRAPFDGVLGLREVVVGDYVSAGDRLTTLVDLSQLQVEFELPENLLPLWLNQPSVQVRLPALGGQLVAAEVLADAAILDPLTRQLTARVSLPQAPSGLRPGMLAELSLSEAARPVMAVPEAALQPRQNDLFVYLVEQDKVRRVSVSSGRRQAGWVEITEGLEAGQELVVHGQDKLRPGREIRRIGRFDGAHPIAELIRQDPS